jgi:hypothetical protein
VSTDPIEPEPALELVMPFVVVASKGGPYDDEAFVAGWAAGELALAMKTLESIGAEVTRTVPTSLVPQIDLIAMQHGYRVQAKPWVEDPDTWTVVRIARPEDEDGDE